MSAKKLTLATQKILVEVEFRNESQDFSNVGKCDFCGGKVNFATFGAIFVPDSPTTGAWCHNIEFIACDACKKFLLEKSEVEEAQRKEWAKRLRKSIPIAGKRKERYSVILGVIAELEVESK